MSKVVMDLATFTLNIVQIFVCMVSDPQFITSRGKVFVTSRPLFGYAHVIFFYGISITYVYLYCLQLLIVTLVSAFMGLYWFRIIK